MDYNSVPNSKQNPRLDPTSKIHKYTYPTLALREMPWPKRPREESFFRSQIDENIYRLYPFSGGDDTACGSDTALRNRLECQLLMPIFSVPFVELPKIWGFFAHWLFAGVSRVLCDITSLIFVKQRAWIWARLFCVPMLQTFNKGRGKCIVKNERDH